MKLEQVKQEIARAQRSFRERMLELAGRVETEEQLREVYVRYLSMQYHLTQGVQRPFFAAAGHPDLSTRRELREFLVRFANEEERHYEMAASDLRELGAELLPVPLDVELWWAYFDRVVGERPFLRLGASCVLENITGRTQGMFEQLVASVSFLNDRNTVFFRAHQHDASAPHGEELLGVLERARLEPGHLADLREGAEKARIMYLRMVSWALQGGDA